MVNRDGKGPQGKGPRTGRGLGKCKSLDIEPEVEFGNGLGRGKGLGKGRGIRRGRR